MSAKKLLFLLIFSVCLFVIPTPGSAQNSYLDEPGIPAFTTSFPVERGFINLANGNLHLEIPIATYAQRGNIKALNARLVYDSRFWIVNTDQVQGIQTWAPNGIGSVGVNVGGGWRLITDGEAGNISFAVSSKVGCYTVQSDNTKTPHYYTIYSNFAYQEPNGTMHRAPRNPSAGFTLYYSPFCGPTTTPSGTAYATDNSGYKFVVTNSSTGSLSTSVFAPDGTLVAISPTALGSPMVQDTNGNFLTAAAGQNSTFTNVVDTLGRTPVITSFSGNQVFLDYLCEPGSTGCDSTTNRARVTVNTAAVNWTTQFNQTGVGEYTNLAGSALQSIVFPDGSKYQFQQDSYGMITSMTLPTGGQIAYGYTNFADYRGNVNRWVTSRQVDGNSWSITPTNLACSTPPCTQQVTVTTPSYNDASTTTNDTHLYTFSVSNPLAFITQIQYFRGAASGTPLVTKNIDYSSVGCPNTITGAFPSRETLTWPLGSGTLSKKAEYCYDSYANRTTVKMWDYQPNGNFATTPDREIDKTYVTDSAYINANIIRLPLTSTTLGPGGVQMGQTTYGYDAGSLQSSGVTTNLNTPSGPRGNPTSVSRWLNTTGSSITSNTAWYDTGQVYQTTDPLGNKPATLTYDSTGAYPSQVCNAKSQCSYSGYDFNTGLLTTSTDANGSKLGDPAHTTTRTYDSMLRLLCTNFPDGGQTCAGYPDPNHITQQEKVTSNLTDVSTTVLDGLGRVSETQHTLPDGVAKVDMTYDPVGAVATVTNPYFTTTDPTYGVIQTLHDTLGRTIQTTMQDGGIRSATYNVTSSGGVNGSCVTSTDEAGKQGAVCHNGFGETVQVLEPGDAFAGSAASGGVTISGTLQTKAAISDTFATGSFTVSGSEQSKSGVGAQPGAAGTGSITISGGEQQDALGNPDTGTVNVVINGATFSAPYGQFDTASTVGTNLAGALSSSAYVNSSLSGSTINLTAKTVGSSTNYSLSSSASSDLGLLPSFQAGLSGSNMTGGTDANPGATVYDSGSCTVTINGTNYSVSFGQGATTSSIAAALAGVIGGGSLSSASASGATISLTAKNAGAGGNYSLGGGNCTYNSSTFSSPSFAVSSSGSSLTGGANAMPAATDAGTVQMSVGGYSATVPYGNAAGQDSTAAAVASDLASKIQAQLPSSNPPFTISASGASININWGSVGTAGNVTMSTTATTTQTGFSAPSFASCSITANPQNCSAALTGGQDPYVSGLAHQPLVTLYNYDTLGNLTCVEQHGDAVSGTGCSDPPSSDATSPYRVRRYTHNSLSQLLMANNPESGRISYQYDANGNLLQTTSPAPNAPAGSTSTQIISYCYDALNRVTGRAYSAQSCTNGQLPAGTAVVSYAYDSGANSIGHLTSLTDQAGTASYTFDPLGRMTGETRTINGVSKSMGYEYNLDGSPSKLHYPSGAVFTYTPDTAGRDVSAVDNVNAINYVTGATYDATGALTGFVSGNSSAFAGITSARSYNNRLQPVNRSASSPNATVFSFNYDFHSGKGDNGNVYGITNNKDTTRTQSFTYDALNRLVSAQNAGTDCSPTTLNPNQTKYWGNSYVDDAWGNLLQKNVTKCSAESLQVTVSNNNQINGFCYDAAGNLLNQGPCGTPQYVYDQENRITGANGETYIYGADGNRLVKTNGTNGTLYWYMAPGIVAESDLAGLLQSEYVFFGGERVARKDFSGATTSVSYYFSDHLKTTDIVTNDQGIPQNESDFFPYGGEVQFLANDSKHHYKFTGKERDAETGLDYFGARYYGSVFGRFITSDPLYLELRRLTDPQQLNIYAYARNNPLKFTDPTGLDVVCTGNRCDDYLKGLQKDVSFNVKYDDKGKVVATVDKHQKLSKSDKALLKAINDTKHHVTINAIDGGKDSSVLFGGPQPGARYTIAFDQTALLDSEKNAGGTTSAQVVGHGTLEADAESRGKSPDDAYNLANGFFPALGPPIGASRGARTPEYLLSVHLFQPVQVNGTQVIEDIEFQFVTPIPIESINNGNARRTPGFPVDVRVRK